MPTLNNAYLDVKEPFTASRGDGAVVAHGNRLMMRKLIRITLRREHALAAKPTLAITLAAFGSLAEVTYGSTLEELPSYIAPGMIVSLGMQDDLVVSIGPPLMALPA